MDSHAHTLLSETQQTTVVELYVVLSLLAIASK